MKKTALSTFPADTVLPMDYRDWFIRLKSRIQGTRQQILLAANQAQIQLYHEIGREILQRQGAAITNFSERLPAPHANLSAPCRNLWTLVCRR